MKTENYKRIRSRHHSAVCVLQQRIQALLGSMASTDSHAPTLAPSKIGSMVFMQSEEIKKASEEYAQKVRIWNLANM